MRGNLQSIEVYTTHVDYLRIFVHSGNSDGLAAVEEDTYPTCTDCADVEA